MRANNNNIGAALGSIMPSIMIHHMKKAITAYPTDQNRVTKVPFIPDIGKPDWPDPPSPTAWVIRVISMALIPMPAPAST